MPNTIKFMYLNHNGKKAERTVDVDAVEFCRDPGYDYQPGWFISGFCHDKQARRSFALSRIEVPRTPNRADGLPLMFYKLLELK